MRAVLIVAVLLLIMSSYLSANEQWVRIDYEKNSDRYEESDSRGAQYRVSCPCQYESAVLLHLFPIQGDGETVNMAIRTARLKCQERAIDEGALTEGFVFNNFCKIDLSTSG